LEVQQDYEKDAEAKVSNWHLFRQEPGNQGDELEAVADK
jgi:hypothetical protein